MLGLSEVATLFIIFFLLCLEELAVFILKAIVWKLFGGN